MTQNRMSKSVSNPCILMACLVLPLLSSLARGGENDAQLRRNIAWQIALDRLHFSPGIIDGKTGPKTELATREFQRVRGLPITGKLDAGTEAALALAVDEAVRNYTVEQKDFSEIGPAPKDWNQRSKLSKLGYESVDAALAEKFRCSRQLLQRLNPGLAMDSLAAGTAVWVPNTEPIVAHPKGSNLQIDLNEKTIKVLDREKRLLALFHCSIAEKKEKRPSGNATVKEIAHNPDYLFDPKMWPEVKNVDRKLVIPPGPRNPVGRCWIGLSLPGYGIHGTPNPEMIGKTGSHGCFRMTNWDAIRLSKMIAVGTSVRFVTSAS